MNTIKLTDYTEFKKHITYVNTYKGEELLKPGDTIRNEDTELTTFVDGVKGRKLGPKSMAKETATIYEYVTAKDKAKGTVSRYAKLTDIVDADILKSYKKDMDDITTKIMRGEISPEDAMAAIEDIKKRQAAQAKA